MNATTIGPGHVGEELLTYAVFDEALEAAAHPLERFEIRYAGFRDGDI